VMGSEDFLEQTFLDNTVRAWLTAAGILLAGLIFKKLFSVLLSKLIYRIFKQHSKGVKMEVFLGLLTRPVSVFIMLILIYLACDRLAFPAEWNLEDGEKFGVRMILLKSFQTAMVISFTWILLRVADFASLVALYKAKSTETRVDDMLIPFVKGGVKLLVVIMGFFTVMGTVFNLNVVTLIGGLGIGGLAVALAAKETLENLLGSFMIFLDKPFVVGEQVKIGDLEGVVESIGFRSTRIRTFERAEVSVPNKKMIDAELENLTKREHRRARFVIGLTYDTPTDTVKKIIDEIQTAILRHSLVEKETVWVRFKEFGASALEIQVNYFVHTQLVEQFLEVREEINYQIVRIVKNNNAQFAFPSTSIYVRQEDMLSSGIPITNVEKHIE
jgi:MscS family membrane protein